jgi:hypothetical protein
VLTAEAVLAPFALTTLIICPLTFFIKPVVWADKASCTPIEVVFNRIDSIAIPTSIEMSGLVPDCPEMVRKADDN